MCTMMEGIGEVKAVGSNGFLRTGEADGLKVAGGAGF